MPLKLGARLRLFKRWLNKSLFDPSKPLLESKPLLDHKPYRPYRPERHYMRGPGPAYEARHPSFVNTVHVDQH
jgi:hypothetical protein